MVPQDNKVVAILNDLLVICKDGENGYRSAQADVADKELQEFFGAFADQRGQFAAELVEKVHALGTSGEQPGSAAARIHRGWMNLKAAVQKGAPGAVLSEVDRGECFAMRHYEEALQHSLPPEVHALLERQYSQLKVAYGRIRALERTLKGM